MKNLGVVCLSSAVILTLGLSGCGYQNSFKSGSVQSLDAVISPTANPLVAQYKVTHTQPGMSAWVEFGTDTTYGRQTSVVSSTATTAGDQSLSLLVAGMLPQTTYHMRAHVDWGRASFVDQDHAFTTAALPNSPPIPQIVVNVPARVNPAAQVPAPGIELLSLSASRSVATDHQGNIIWYCPLPTLLVRPMQSGHFMLLQPNDLLEVDVACNTVRDVSLSQVSQSLQASGHSYNLVNFSHDVLTLANGHWITIVQISQDFTNLPGYPGTTSVLGDLIVEIDPTGNVVWSWSAFDHLDITRYPYFGLPDWTHTNALVYTQDNDLLLSIRNQSWIIKIDYANGTGSGDVLWKLGPEGDFTLLGGDPTEWFYSQHYPNVLSVNGSQTTLAVYDNGNYRIDPGTGFGCGTNGAPGCYTRATIFQVDESTRLVTLLWQDLPGYFSLWGGSIDLLDNGNIEFDSSDPFFNAASQVTEVTQTDPPQVVWQMSIDTNAYRGYRLPSLYPGVTWLK